MKLKLNYASDSVSVLIKEIHRSMTANDYCFRAMLLSGGDAAWTAGDTEKIRLSREEDLYKQEMIRLEKDLT